MKPVSHIPFFKLSATGNDFILFDNRERYFTGEETDFFRHICQRRRAVGADGILLIEASPDYDFHLRYFNADGRESEMCGNGARAAAFYFWENYGPSERLTFTVGSTVYEARAGERGVSLKMPAPADVRGDVGVAEEAFLEEGGYLDIGVPHFVVFTDDLDAVDVPGLGARYRHHRAFVPRGVNVDFVEVLGANRLKIRTYERGVEEETLACGTGCAAAALVAVERKQMAWPIELLTRGGVLRVERPDPSGPLFLEGEATLVYEGRLLEPERLAREAGTLRDGSNA